MVSLANICENCKSNMVKTGRKITKTIKHFIFVVCLFVLTLLLFLPFLLIYLFLFLFFCFSSLANPDVIMCIYLWNMMSNCLYLGRKQTMLTMLTTRYQPIPHTHNKYIFILTTSMNTFFNRPMHVITFMRLLLSSLMMGIVGAACCCCCRWCFYCHLHCVQIHNPNCMPTHTNACKHDADWLRFV